MTASWLKDFAWEIVVETNRLLCQPKGAFHGPTSDGYAATERLWSERHAAPMTLADAVELCRQCHRMAPFCNYNGNTFVAVIRRVIARLQLSPEHASALRSVAGHIVAGTATPEEARQLAELIRQYVPTDMQ
jgi:hypothetical protein